MRRIILCTALLLCAAPFANAGRAAVVTPRVVGGSLASPASAPWQALVLPASYLCGGSILDATHVVTAAHCVFDDDAHTVTAPPSVAVSVGLTDRQASGAPRQNLTVTDVSVDPHYDPSAYTDDAAVLTIGGASIDLSGASATAIALPPAEYAPSPATDLQLSGWGTTTAYAPDQTNPGTTSRYLKVGTVHTSPACADAYADYDPQLEICAGQAGTDACQGDSGGPLATQLNGTWTLIGIISSGAGCGNADTPGLFTNAAADGMRSFLTSRGADGLRSGTVVAAPVNTTLPTIAGTAQPGGRLTCDPGAWTGAGETYTYTFRRDDGAWRGVAADLNVINTDVGATITCTVTATGPGGSTQATSPPVAVHDTPPTPPVSTPATTTPPPVSRPAAATITAVPVVHAPKARVSTARCSRTTCTLTVVVSEAGASPGDLKLAAFLKTTYRTRCNRHGHRSTCTRSRTTKLHPVALGEGR